MEIPFSRLLRLRGIDVVARFFEAVLPVGTLVNFRVFATLPRVLGALGHGLARHVCSLTDWQVLLWRSLDQGWLVGWAVVLSRVDVVARLGEAVLPVGALVDFGVFAPLPQILGALGHCLARHVRSLTDRQVLLWRSLDQRWLVGWAAVLSRIDVVARLGEAILPVGAFVDF